MINGNVEIGLIHPSHDEIQWFGGKNTISSYGLRRIRDALIGTGNALDSNMQIREDGNLIANMDTGYPIAASSSNKKVIWQGSKTLTSSLSVTYFQLYDSRAVSGGYLMRIARTSLKPTIPSSIASGTTLIVRWSLGVTTGISPGDVAGTDRQKKIDNGEIGFANIIIGDESASTSGEVKVFQSTSQDRAPTDKQQYSRVGSPIDVTFSADGNKARLLTSDFSYPAITGPTSFERWHSAELYLNDYLARVFYEDETGVRRDNATPNQSTDILLSNA